MLLPSPDALQVQHEPALRLLRFQWVSPLHQALRPAFERGRDLVVHWQAERVLLDLCCLPLISPPDERWLTTQWLAGQQWPPMRQLALVACSGHLHNLMALEDVLWPRGLALCYELQFFDDADAALDWLADGCPRAVGGLQSEWARRPGERQPCHSYSGPTMRAAA